MKKLQMLGPYEQRVRVARSTRLNQLEVEATADLAARTPERVFGSPVTDQPVAPTQLFSLPRALARWSYDPS